jgi:hypothetical protein
MRWQHHKRMGCNRARVHDTSFGVIGGSAAGAGALAKEGGYCAEAGGGAGG